MVNHIVRLYAAPAWIALGMVSLAPAQENRFDTDGFTWEQPIAAVETDGFVTLPLGRGVLDGAQESLNDLRILDSDDRLVPHVIKRERIQKEPTLEQRPVQVINRTYQVNEYARVVLDFGENVNKNQVEVEVSGTNFRRRAQIEGSNDSNTWEMVAEDLWLFDVRLRGKEFFARTLEFPSNNFRYLRVTVFHMREDPDRIEIERVTSSMKVPPLPEQTEEITLDAGPRKWDDDAKMSKWNFDFGSRNLPVAMLDFEITDGYFYRGYELYGRNSTTQTVTRRTETGISRTEEETPWRLLRSGMLYRTVSATTTTQDLRLDQLGPSPRHLQLRVFDADNPPLTLTKLVAAIVFPKLVFEAKPGQEYLLVYGNEKVGAPNYDLQRAVLDLDPDSLPPVSLGAANRLTPTTKLAPWTERYVTWLQLLLLAAAIMLGLIMARGLRKLPPGNSKQE